MKTWQMRSGVHSQTPPLFVSTPQAPVGPFLNQGIRLAKKTMAVGPDEASMSLKPRKRQWKHDSPWHILALLLLARQWKHGYCYQTWEEGGAHCWRALAVCLTPGGAADGGVATVRWRAGPAAVHYNGEEQAEWENGGLTAGCPKPEEPPPSTRVWRSRRPSTKRHLVPSHGTASEGISVGRTKNLFPFFLSPISCLCPSSSLHLLSLTLSCLTFAPKSLVLQTVYQNGILWDYCWFISP